MTDLISGHPVQIHFHPCNPVLLPRKYLFYLVLWELLIKFICVFGGIWQHNVEIENKNCDDQP